MAKTSTFTTPFRRRKQGKTNYKKRLSMLKSTLPRLVVRKTNKYIIAQLIEFNPKGDKTMVHANSKDLEKFGWKAGKKNLPAAYLTGLLAATKAKKAKIDKAILDIGFAMPKRKGWWSSALLGARDAGLAIKAGEEALPTNDRTSGKHIELFAKTPAGKKAFSKVRKKTNPENLTEEFEKVKQKIMKAKVV